MKTDRSSTTAIRYVGAFPQPSRYAKLATIAPLTAIPQDRFVNCLPTACQGFLAVSEDHEAETVLRHSLLQRVRITSHRLPRNRTIRGLHRSLLTRYRRGNIRLFELLKSDGPKIVDVVAVRGLQGDTYMRWEHDNGLLWLRDFSPADVPFARIMTFGYDSSVE